MAAQYTFASSCPNSTLQSWSCQYCNGELSTGVTVQFISYDAATDNTCYVATNDNTKEIVLVFRGTEIRSINNFVTDLKFAKSSVDLDNFPNCSVHTGFLKSYKAHRAVIMDKLPGIMQNFRDYNLVIMGHSLGGAQATICAMDLLYNNGLSTRLVTLGSPRVGDSDFYNNFDPSKIQHIRFTHDNDAVVHLPPEWFGFKHVQHEVWSHNGQLVECNDSQGEDTQCSYSVSFTSYSISDHLTYFGIKSGCESDRASSPNADVVISSSSSEGDMA